MATRVHISPRSGDRPESGIEDLLTPPEEARAFFDSEARRLMGMSGPEFLRKWDADEFDVDGPDHTKLISMEFIIPFGRA